jgi:hypothetical protein
MTKLNIEQARDMVTHIQQATIASELATIAALNDEISHVTQSCRQNEAAHVALFEIIKTLINADMIEADFDLEHWRDHD